MAAAEAMRRILVELRAANIKSDKAAIGTASQSRWCTLPMTLPAEELLALDESLRRLEEHDLAASKLVKLRYFAGMTMAEAADALGVPLRTAERNWTYARSWLYRDLR